MLTRCLQTAALVVTLSIGCATPAENPHGVSVASCDASLAEKLYAPGAIDAVEESHRVDMSHGSEEHIVTGASLKVRSIEDASAFEQALRCHSVRSRATAAASRNFDPLIPTGWAPEISVTAAEAGLVHVHVTSKHRETATSIVSRARALLDRSKASSPADPPAAPAGT